MPEPIAIVGMAAVFPGAPDLATFRDNLERGVDAIGSVPADRVDPVFMAGFACKRGGFVAPTFDPVAFGIMPVAALSAEPDQLLALHVAAAALADAGPNVARARTGVILGRGGYLTPGMARLANRVRGSEQLVATLAELLPDLDPATVAKIREAFRARAGESGGEAGIGLVPNLAASRIANRLDLRGPAYCIDAACASSLLAVDQGCRELADRRVDAVVAGGVHVCHDVTLWSVFSELGALSPSSAIRPFDRRADGIVIGEGAGVVVLKRLADAERDGDRVYAVIRGCGVSSDGRESSAMRPRADGQLAALEAAWRAADRDPASVGLVEAHGTATPTGDEVELEALGRFFGEAHGGGERAALGSVKSMIGHAMPAAGAAGLIKAALAVHHGVLPPSLHCDEPHAAVGKTRFRVRGAAEAWPAELPRRAGVSAFGFGGINAHVMIEGHARSAPMKTVRGTSAPTPVLAIRGASIAELREALETGVSGAGPMRLAMIDPTPERKLLAEKVLDRGKAWRGNHDIWFAPVGLAADGGKLALVFPGIEATFAADVGAIARALGVALPPAIPAANAGSPTELEARGLGVFALGRLLAAALARLGVAPDAIAGHSMGEWTGMAASEMIPPDAIDGFLGELPASLAVPDVVFAAVGCGAGGALSALEGLDTISLSHDNCPHQSIICGQSDRVRTALARLATRGVLCQELPFRSGFHSPLFASYLAPHRARLATMPLQAPRIPLWSATTAAPYPADLAAVRVLASDHLVQPVRFRELVEALHADGVRAFVQVGVGSVTGFVEDTLRGKEHLAIAAVTAKHPGLAQLARVGAALWVDGFIPSAAVELGTPPVARTGTPLVLGVPLVRMGRAVTPLSLGGRPAVSADGDPILAELLATLDEAASSARAVVDAYRAGASAPRAAVAAPAARPAQITAVPPPAHKREVTRRALSADIEPALLDHCFYRQPPGWPTVSDRYPVVPMTMTIGMMLEAAVRLAPTRVAIAIAEVRALRWLAVAPPIDVELVTRIVDADRIDVELPGYARATIHLADRYPDAPAPALAPLVHRRPPPLTAERMYGDRWMFHGPRYQGVTTLGPLGDDGVDGVIDVLPAPGALLDCAGQLMGWWVMNHEARDRLAMPVRIQRIALYGPHPAAAERVACSVRMRHVGEREVRADLELARGGRVWAKIDGWEDRRFDSDGPVWDMLMYPETHALAVAQPGGYVLVTEHWRGAASRELMMRRYLGEAERADHDALGPRARRGWLLGRIAVKDAVRMHRWETSASPIWPVEIAVGNTPSGQPIVDGVRVSIAHKDDRAVALVDATRACGIDIERIEPRTEGFLRVAYTAAELALGEGDAHLARLWAAKEAVGKARGTGVTDPKKLEVRVADAGRLAIGDAIIETYTDGDHVIAWTKL